jgi:hypothetical protein
MKYERGEWERSHREVVGVGLGIFKIFIGGLFEKI